MMQFVDYLLGGIGSGAIIALMALALVLTWRATRVVNFAQVGQAMFTKCIVVVDEDVDVQNPREVVWKALNNIDPERDIQFVLGPVDSLDHASRLPNLGSKMGIDATRKWPQEGFTRPWPGLIEMSPEVKRRVDELWRQAGL